MSHTYRKSIARVFTGAGARYPAVRMLFGFFLQGIADPLISCLDLAGELTWSAPRISFLYAWISYECEKIKFQTPPGNSKQFQAIPGMLGHK